MRRCLLDLGEFEYLVLTIDEIKRVKKQLHEMIEWQETIVTAATLHAVLTFYFLPCDVSNDALAKI